MPGCGWMGPDKMMLIVLQLQEIGQAQEVTGGLNTAHTTTGKHHKSLGSHCNLGELEGHKLDKV